MLITFDNVGIISYRRHEFFEDVFIALWIKHDARKGGHERQKHTGLERTAFFSLSSYLSEEQGFRDSRLAFHVERANRVTNMAVSEKAFERDMTTGTSLLVRDGQELRFIHRSFQEYFAAVCICTLSDEKTAAVIEKISSRYQTDAVLSLILSINDDKIERNWVLPRLRVLVDKVAKLTDDNPERKYFDVLAHDKRATHFMHPCPPACSTWVLTDDGKFVDKLRVLYGLRPRLSEIFVAVDAAADSASLRTSAYALVRKDKENVMLLLEQLEKKYAMQGEGFEELF